MDKTEESELFEILSDEDKKILDGKRKEDAETPYYPGGIISGC